MPDTSQKPCQPDRKNPAAAVVGKTAQWLGLDEDVALGCECADPALQIERWGQEALPCAQRAT